MAKAASPRTIWIDLENTPHVPFFVPRSEEHTSELQSPCRSEEHTSELQSPCNLVCRLLLEKKKKFRTGLNSNGSLLVHANVNTYNFSKLSHYRMAGHVYTHLLFLSELP